MTPVTFFRQTDPSRLATWALVTGISLLHLLVAPRVGLSVDEAHYALYGLHLDWSYFDHPPMVGWLQALVLPFSQSELALRAIPILLTAAASLVLYELSRELFPEESPWTGFIAVALLQGGIIVQLVGLAMVPDGPLLLFGLLAVRRLRQALMRDRLQDWLWSGLFLGLAGLSKYTAVTLAAGALPALFAAGRWRLLLSAGPWAAVAVGLLLILPVIGWNYAHDWISFGYQIEHGTRGEQWSIQRFLLGQTGQLLAYAPALYLFGWLALVGGLREWRHPGVRDTLCFALPVLLLFGWNSGFYTTLPHWTVLGWAITSPLAARWLLRQWHRRWVRITAWGSAGFSALLAGIVFSQLLHPWIPFEENNHPLRDLYGWKQAALRAEALRQRLPSTPENPPRIFVENWTFASRIAWYARPTAVQVLDGRHDQFDLWFGSPQQGARGILVTPSYYRGHKGTRLFEQCTELSPLPIPVNGKPAVTFRYFACEGFRTDESLH